MKTTNKRPLAPELQVSDWLNTSTPLTLEDLKEKVVVIEAFQMLCPGCVSHGLPQAQKIRQLFAPNEVAVIGLHTVFEHHEAQGTRTALEAFLHEYRIEFPVGIDARDGSSRLPKTMQTYGLQGTPSLLILDREGRIAHHQFGRPDDMAIGAAVMSLLKETRNASGDTAESADTSNAKDEQDGCGPEGCRVG